MHMRHARGAWGTRAFCSAAVLLAAGAAQAQLAGAIFTTNENGQRVNQNIYNRKDDVYLNGGPQNSNGSLLMAGIYFFQVTSPSGRTLLSTDPAVDRLVYVGTNGRILYQCNTNGVEDTTPAHDYGSFNSANGGSMPIQLMPFDNTPNNGGEYKAWLILYRRQISPGVFAAPVSQYSGRYVTFSHRWAKTDNFKIKPKVCPDGDLSGMKFFDFNLNGRYDPGSGEAPIAGFIIKIVLNGTTTLYRTTDSTGFWEVQDLPGGTTYTVHELLPPDAQYGGAGSLKWVQTAPGTPNDAPADRGYSGKVCGDVRNLDFGNTQVVTISGIKFYDRNQNGVKDGDETNVSGFPIRMQADLPDGSPTITVNKTTNSSGAYVFNALGVYPGIPIGTSFTISEVIPSGTTWVQTAPPGGTHSGTVPQPAGPYTVNTNAPNITNLNFGNVLQARLSGIKFYDSNQDGDRDSDEPTIHGFKILIYIKEPGDSDFALAETLYTNSSGAYQSQLYTDGTQFKVYEQLPSGDWVQTAPPGGFHQGTLTSAGPYTVSSTIPNVTGLDFGNYVEIDPQDGHTLGFWHNKNGFDRMNDGGTVGPELALLNTCNLRNGDGTLRTFTTWQQLSDWLVSANASNMANMLSAQLAAMVLNVEAGFVNPNALMWAPGALSADTLGRAKVGDVINEAKASLALYGYTPEGHPQRAYQGALKTALDRGNNNTNWVTVVLPPITYVPHPY